MENEENPEFLNGTNVPYFISRADETSLRGRDITSIINDCLSESGEDYEDFIQCIHDLNLKTFELKKYINVLYALRDEPNNDVIKYSVYLFIVWFDNYLRQGGDNKLVELENYKYHTFDIQYFGEVQYFCKYIFGLSDEILNSMREHVIHIPAIINAFIKQSLINEKNKLRLNRESDFGVTFNPNVKEVEPDERPEGLYNSIKNDKIEGKQIYKVIQACIDESGRDKSELHSCLDDQHLSKHDLVRYFNMLVIVKVYTNREFNKKIKSFKKKLFVNMNKTEEDDIYSKTFNRLNKFIRYKKYGQLTDMLYFMSKLNDYQLNLLRTHVDLIDYIYSMIYYPKSNFGKSKKSLIEPYSLVEFGLVINEKPSFSKDETYTDYEKGYFIDKDKLEGANMENIIEECITNDKDDIEGCIRSCEFSKTELRHYLEILKLIDPNTDYENDKYNLIKKHKIYIPIFQKIYEDKISFFGKKTQNKTQNKKEKIININVSGHKKYKATVKNIKTSKTRSIHFGAKGYQQYKDSTSLKKYKSKNHGDSKRRKLYFKRHSGVDNKKEALALEWKKSKGLYNAKILSHIYLW